LAGATSPAQVASNVAAGQAWRLNAAEQAEVDAIAAGPVMARVRTHQHPLGPLTLLFMIMLGQGYPGGDRYNVAPTQDRR